MALDAPQAMVYGFKFANSVFGKAKVQSYEGPSNYIAFTGQSLIEIPFDDNSFDVVTAKSLWYIVKKDQWGDVLKEIFRILKPGGCIELMVSDYSMLNPSPIDSYWWDRLREGVVNYGLDPIPSESIPDHLMNNGFCDIHRALIALPRGWGGQVGHVTDFLSMFYAEQLFSIFGGLSTEEKENFKRSTGASLDMGFFPANKVSLFYAIKPAG